MQTKIVTVTFESEQMEIAEASMRRLLLNKTFIRGHRGGNELEFEIYAASDIDIMIFRAWIAKGFYSNSMLIKPIEAFQLRSASINERLAS